MRTETSRAAPAKPAETRVVVARVPVVSVLERDGESLDRDKAWPAFREAYRESSRSVAVVSNATVSRLVADDLPVISAARERGETKIPKQPKRATSGPEGLYMLARALAPALATTTTSAVVRAVERRYRQQRFGALWLNRERTPTYCVPAPVPITAQTVKVIAHEGGSILLSVPLGASRWLLRLAGGKGHWRANLLLRRVADGELEHGEVKLLETGGPHARPQDRETMAVICVRMPEEQRTERPALTLYVRSARECLVTYSFAGQAEAFRVNAGHLRRWVAEHRARLQRTSDDMKHERRCVGGRPDKDILEIRHVWEAQQRRRLDSLTHEISAHLAAFAERRGATLVVFDGAETGYVESFPWHELRSKLAYKLDARGIKHEGLARACPMTSESASVAIARRSESSSVKRSGRVGVASSKKKSAARLGKRKSGE